VVAFITMPSGTSDSLAIYAVVTSAGHRRSVAGLRAAPPARPASAGAAPAATRRPGPPGRPGGGCRLPLRAAPTAGKGQAPLGERSAGLWLADRSSGRCARHSMSWWARIASCTRRRYSRVPSTSISWDMLPGLMRGRKSPCTTTLRGRSGSVAGAVAPGFDGARLAAHGLSGLGGGGGQAPS